MSFKSPRLGTRILACTIGLVSLAGLGAAGSAHAADPASLCPTDTTIYAPSEILATNQVGSAGCVTISINAAGGAKIAWVETQPGWTYSIKSAGVTSNGSRVQIEFVNKATRAKASLRWESGKVVIK